MPEIEEAYIDVFIAGDTDEYDEGACDYELSTEDIVTLERIGLPIRFTIRIGKP